MPLKMGAVNSPTFIISDGNETDLNGATPTSSLSIAGTPVIDSGGNLGPGTGGPQSLLRQYSQINFPSVTTVNHSLGRPAILAYWTLPSTAVQTGNPFVGNPGLNNSGNSSFTFQFWGEGVGVAPAAGQTAVYYTYL